MKLPTTTNALVLGDHEQSQASTYLDVRLEKRSIPPLKTGQLLVQINAVSFNRRDLWIRQKKYPNIAPGSVLGSDGAGVVIATSSDADPLLHKRVFLTPARGWESSLDGPESQFGLLGGCKFPELGTFSEYVVVDRDEVIETPDHLDDIHASAWPVAGVTAWRAVVVKARVQRGQNVLITGIGGGVALVAMQLCLTLGANVFVTSGDKQKINLAVQQGAKGGVNYNSTSWPTQLAALLEPRSGKAYLDAIIDSAGNDICSQTVRILKLGAVVVCYGVTAAPQITFTMREILKNIELKGSTMGSRKELLEATQFLRDHRIVPGVSDVIDGLERAEEAFNLLQSGKHYGKIVIRLRDPQQSSSRL